MRGWKRTSKKVSITLNGVNGGTLMQGKRAYIPNANSNDLHIVIRQTMESVIDIIKDYWNDYFVVLSVYDEETKSYDITYFSDGNELDTRKWEFYYKGEKI